TAQSSTAAEGTRRILPALVLFIAVVGIVALLGRTGVTLIDGRSARDYGAFAIGLAGALLATRLIDIVLFDLAYRVRGAAPAPELLRQLVSLLVFGVFLVVLCKVVLSVSLPAILTTSAIITAVLGLALQ